MNAPVLSGFHHVHFIGIGGIGMSALAQWLCAEGMRVTGTDRSCDQGRDPWLFNALRAQGVELLPQSRTSLDLRPDCVVISRAIDESNQELQEARTRGIPLLLRSQVLASCVNSRQGVGVSGTSGKSTTTAMVAWILEQAGLDPLVLLGAITDAYVGPDALGNFRRGTGPVVAEIDESDGCSGDYHPEVAALTNISKDHFSPDELVRLLGLFIDRARRAVLNADCSLSRELAQRVGDRVMTFGNEGNVRATRIQLGPSASSFEVDGMPFYLPLPGRHNIANALCAVAVARCFDVPDRVSREALAAYQGLRRRWSIVGVVSGVEVVDDFAHSPAKILSAISTAHLSGQRVCAVFQPHGYGPTKFLWNEYIDAFAEGLGRDDVLFLLEIYDAGGLADRTVSSGDLARALGERGVRVLGPLGRDELVSEVKRQARSGDVVLVMGARDHSLSGLARQIVSAL